MPILAAKPIYEPKGKPTNKTAGFSLLEMLIVLALLGLVIGISTPRLTLYASALEFSKKSQTIIYSLKRHRTQALINKRARLIIPNGQDSAPLIQNSTDQIALELPEGWTASGEPLYISASGHCRGGLISLTGPSQRTIDYRISSPDCTATEIISNSTDP